MYLCGVYVETCGHAVLVSKHDLSGASFRVAPSLFSAVDAEQLHHGVYPSDVEWPCPDRTQQRLMGVCL